MPGEQGPLVIEIALALIGTSHNEKRRLKRDKWYRTLASMGFAE